MKLNFMNQSVRGGISVGLLLGTMLTVPYAYAAPNINSTNSTVSPVSKERTITGTVTSKVDGQPLPGVNIFLKGTQIGTSTDVNGKYTLAYEDRDRAVLTYSYIGFDMQEMTVGSQSVINVALSENVRTLDEAVVTALGIKREQKSLTYAIAKVGGEDIVNVAQENVMNSLAGRVAGLTLNQTGGVGSSVSMVIRGATSLSGDNQPLFVIDGVPMMNNLARNVQGRGDRNNVDYGSVISDINPEDVESISVLKGPAAAALYGSRAGNGVVMITTKSGKASKGLGVTFTTSNVFETPYRFLDVHYKYANGDRNHTFSQSSAYWAGPELDKGNMAVQWDSPVGPDGVKIPTELRSYKDNVKNFLQTGFTTTNNLAISGANDKGHFRVAFDMMRNNDLIPNSGLARNGLSSGAEYKLNKRVKLSTNLNFVNSYSDNRASNDRQGALDMAYTMSNVDIRKLKDVWVSGGEGIQQLSPTTNFDNPYFIAYGITNAYNRNHSYGNVRLDFDLGRGFSFYTRMTHDWANEKRETSIPWSYTRGRQGAYHIDQMTMHENNMDAMLTYRKKINNFDIVLNGGGNSMYRTFEASYMGGQPLVIPSLYRITNVPVAARGSRYNTEEKRIMSVFAMANIGYKDQFFLDLTARNDWSSTLPINNRSYFYPSAGFSWVANNTFKMPSSVSLLKFYANLAGTGNDTNPYQLANMLGIGSWGDLVTTTLPGISKNNQLKPELQSSYELGLTMNLFKNRIRFDGSYFDMINKNQILDVNSAPSSGFALTKVNAGRLSSKGIELSLGGSPIRDLNGWNVDVDMNLSRIRTRIDELYGDLGYYNVWGNDENGGGATTKIGEEIGDIYSRGYLKVEDPKSPYYQWPILGSNGQWQNNNDFNAREKVGNFNPRFIVGGQVNVRYKRFNLAASFDWRSGGDFISFSYRYMESDWRSQRQIDNLIPGSLMSKEELAAMLKSDPAKYIIPQNGNFPRVGGHTAETGGFPLGQSNDAGFVPGVIIGPDGQYIEHLGGEGTVYQQMTSMFPWSFNKQITFDASFVKLRELSLGYNVPNFYRFSNVNVSVYTRNIMLWTAAKVGIDPERAFRNNGTRFMQGIEFYNAYPWTMPIGFKLSLSF